MVTSGSVDITTLLKAWSAGDCMARDELIPLVYNELKRLARRCMRKERTEVTLQTTALVHEAYLRLVGLNQIGWRDRAHFFAMGAETMRRILVDAARARTSIKRGGQAGRLPALTSSLNIEDLNFSSTRDREVIRIDEALDAMAQFDGRKARVIELRFFGGLSVEEAAAVLQISPQTVMRDWRLAKAWLTRDLLSTPERRGDNREDHYRLPLHCPGDRFVSQRLDVCIALSTCSPFRCAHVK